MNELKIEYIDINKITPYENNARKHQKDDITAIKKSIESFGMNDPIGIWSDKNIIIEGHGRLLALKELGYETVPCIRLDQLTDQQRKAYALAHNKTAELSEWDLDKLSEELKFIDMDMEQFGFEDLEESMERDVLEDNFDENEELPVNPYAKKGDVFVLGNHRLMCGDSTKSEDVKKLVDGQIVDMIFTDPPYNVDYEGTAGKIQNDKQEDGAFFQFLTDAFTNMYEVSKPGAPIYCFHADSEGLNFRSAFKEAGFKLSECLIWEKDSFVFGRQDYHWKHEPCQPAGTMVKTPDGEKPIELLKDGDRVLTFSKTDCIIKGMEKPFTVKTASREYKGKLYTLVVGDKRTRVTPNHKITIKFNDQTTDMYCSYLMKRGNWWRVGITSMYNSRGFGLKQRLRQEKGEACWILETYKDKMDAQRAEQTISVKFSVPQTHWETGRFKDNKCRMRTNEDIQWMYEQLDLDELERNAKKCLAHFNREYDYPFITKENQDHHLSSIITSQIEACNLIPKIMVVPVPLDKYFGSHNAKWTTLDDVLLEDFDGKVYSLDVEKFGHYIADGIIVHNCLYGWKEGAAHYFVDDHTQDTIWIFPKPKHNDLHPTMKPLELVGRAIKNSSRKNENVLDLFGGSGSTLIASEQIERNAFLMELDERYVDVIVKRYLRFVQSYENSYLIRDGKKITLSDIADYNVEFTDLIM